MQKIIKDWTLVFAILFGLLFNSYLVYLSPLVPYLIATMLFMAFAKVDFTSFRLNKMHLIMFTIQIVSALALYIAISPFNEIVAQGAMICVLIPTAASASVVVGMLGGSIASVAIYTLFSNIAIAILLPFLLSIVGIEAQDSFIKSIFIVSKNVLTIFIIPLFAAYLINKYMVKVRKKVEILFPYSYYLWAFS